MDFLYEERASDSPYVETITRGRTAGNGSTIRPAESHWHLVFAKHNGNVQALVAGPLTTADVLAYTEGVEILWIKFRLGTFMPHLPTRNLLDAGRILPDAVRNAFWLNSTAWQIPNYENADTFVDRLVRDDVLACDPLVNAVLQDQPQALSVRTVRHRFLRATGLTQSTVRQIQHAQQATALLAQGKSILDTVHEVGYADQPHLTRSLKRLMGYTPAQILSTNKSE
jgi:hypothetical protein